MSPSPNGRDEVRKKAYKHSVDGDEARRKREDSALEVRRSKRDESLSRKRREGTPTQNSAAEKKVRLRISRFFFVFVALSHVERPSERESERIDYKGVGVVEALIRESLW